MCLWILQRHILLIFFNQQFRDPWELKFKHHKFQKSFSITYLDKNRWLSPPNANCPLLITIANIPTSTLLRLLFCVFSASSFYCTISTFEMVQRLMSDLERNKTSPDLSPEWCFSRHTLMPFKFKICNKSIDIIG